MDSAEAIASPLKKERLRLQQDGWLIYEQKNLTEPWQVAHHLIADGAIIELLSDDASCAPHAADLLKFAATSDMRKQVLQSLRRVVGEPIVSKVDWPILFERLRDSWQGWVGKIALSGLIEGSRLIEWLTNMQFTTNDLTVHADVRSAIRRTLRDVAQAQRKLTDIERDWVTATFHSASDVTEQGFILSHWLRADQKNENLSALARSWLALNGGTRYAGYVYAAWLESGGDIEVARPMFDNWLTKNNTRHDAVNPIVAWLDATSDVTSESIVDAVRYWIAGKARAQSMGASYLYRAWLKQGGEVGMIRKQLTTWMNLYSVSYSAQYVFNAWLERIHDDQINHSILDCPSIPVELDVVVRIWLENEEHWTKFAACFVYSNWLNAKGEVDLVREPIIRWLASRDAETTELFATDFDAGRRVLTSWLQASREPDIVDAHVDAWLKCSNNGLREEARVIFVGWLAAGGAPEFIREPLKAWLKNIPFSSQTEQVLSAWLANGGAVDDVESYVSRRTVEMPVATLRQTDFLIGRWRDAGGQRTVVEMAVIKRAKRLASSPDSY